MKHEMNVLGIDIAKRVFHAVGMDNTGKIVFRKRLSRHDLMPFIAKLPPVCIGITDVVNGFGSWSSAAAKTARRSRSQTKMLELSGHY
jgi:transposase